MNQIVQIANNIKQAHADDAKGLTRLHLSIAIALLQELSTDLTKCMLENSHAKCSILHMSNIHLNIFDV